MITRKDYEAFARGQDDAREGKPRQNPYHHRSRYYDLWEQGYQAELDIVWK